MLSFLSGKVWLAVGFCAAAFLFMAGARFPADQLEDLYRRVENARS